MMQTRIKKLSLSSLILQYILEFVIIVITVEINREGINKKLSVLRQQGIAL